MWVPLNGQGFQDFKVSRPATRLTVGRVERETESCRVQLEYYLVAGCGSKVQGRGGGSKPKEEEPYFTSQQGVGTLNVVRRRGGWAGEG